MSLSDLRKVTEDAVTFRSHIDGAKVELSPERAVEIQALLGSDISMQLDECIRLPANAADIERAMRLSLALGGALETRLRRLNGPRPVWHRAGRRRSARCASKARAPRRYGLSRLRHRRACASASRRR